MNSGTKNAVACGGILLICLLWSLGLGRLALFDWDEINFAEIAREMYHTGDLLQPTINYLPFHEKPPLFPWLQWLSYQVFGVGAFAARFPNIVCGGATLALLGWYGRQRGLGWWWAAFYTGSLLPSLYFRSGIIDPWFNLFTLLALLPLFLPGRVPLSARLIAAGCLGLAILTKGPVAALIVGLVSLCLLLFDRGKRFGTYVTVGLLSLLPAAVWLGFLWLKDDGFFLRAFVDYQWRLLMQEDAGHGGFPGYHVVVLLLGCFPASFYALPALFGGRRFFTPSDRGMRILFWVVLILFSIVNTKIVHYSSLCYFPLTWFAARWTTSVNPQEGFPSRLLLGLRSVWGLYFLLALLVAVAGWSLPYWLPYITDQELLSRLRMPVDWPWYAILPALVGGAVVGLDRAVGHRIPRRAALHLAGMFLFCLVALPVFLPRIQAYTQGAAVAFYRDLAGQPVFLTTARYKSYTPLFYGEVTEEFGARKNEVLFYTPQNRDIYFSSPLRLTERALEDVPDAELLYQRGGFSFFRLKAVP